MRKYRSPLLLNYLFEGRKIGLGFVVAISLILALFLLLFDPTNAHLIQCLASGVFVLLFIVFHSWKEISLTVFKSLIYILTSFLEYYLMGMEQYSVVTNNRVDKGLFMDLLISFVPILYYGLRIFAAIPLILILQIFYQMNLKSKY